jgi:hypothetical protein
MLTDAGRRKAAKSLKARRDGWPRKTTTWSEALEWRRFDEPGMEVRERPNPMPRQGLS